jgi:acetyltransferase-like isoleucine patch superfamily enzyme
MSDERRGGLTSHLWKLRVDPVQTVKTALAVLRGRAFPFWCRLRGVRFQAGRNFRIYGRLDVDGPGLVTVGDDVMVIEHTRIRTHSREARISIGDRTLLGQTRFGGVREIVVGADCQLGEAYIMDTDFHSTRADRRTSAQAPIRVAPVRIGDNVWVGHYCGVLAGTRIGANSVVSFGAVCMREYPDNVILVGNPAKVAAPVPSAPGEPAAGAPGGPLSAAAAGGRTALSLQS